MLTVMNICQEYTGGALGVEEMTNSIVMLDYHILLSRKRVVFRGVRCNRSLGFKGLSILSCYTHSYSQARTHARLHAYTHRQTHTQARARNNILINGGGGGGYEDANMTMTLYY